MPEQLNDGEVIDLAEAARLLGMGESTLRDRVKGRRRPMVPHFKLGNRIKFLRSTLKTWLAELEREHSSRGAA